MSAEHLVLGLQTGAADGFTGLSANPALGAAVDLLVAHGGTAILSETPEILLAEDAFVARAATPAVAEALRARLDWWRGYNRGKDTQLNGRLDRGHERGRTGQRSGEVARWRQQGRPRAARRRLPLCRARH